MTDEQLQEDLPPAYFLSLTVENVRCFGPEQTLDLTDEEGNPAQWTVLLGDNGTGKTTLLQAVVHLLPYDRRAPNRNEINVGELIQTPRISELGRPEHYRTILRSGTVTGRMSASLRSGVGENTIEIDEFSFTIEDRGMAASASVLSCSTGNRISVRASAYGASREMSQEGFEETDSSGVEGLFKDGEKLPNAHDWLLQTDYAAKSDKKKAEERLSQIKKNPN